MTTPPLDRREAQAGTDDAGTPALGVVVWALLGGGITWSLHLLLAYVAIAWACTVGGGRSARIVLLLLSVLAMAGVASAARLAWKHWHVSRRLDRPGDDTWDARLGERTSRVSFIMVVALFLNALFALGIVYDGATSFVSPLCAPGIED